MALLDQEKIIFILFHFLLQFFFFAFYIFRINSI